MYQPHLFENVSENGYFSPIFGVTLEQQNIFQTTTLDLWSQTTSTRFFLKGSSGILRCSVPPLAFGVARGHRGAEGRGHGEGRLQLDFFSSWDEKLGIFLMKYDDLWVIDDEKSEICFCASLRKPYVWWNKHMKHQIMNI